MARAAFLLPALCLSFTKVYAAEMPSPSLFFTAEEVNKIESLMKKETPAVVANNDVHLGAVIYYGPGDWVVWLQGQRWTPRTEQPDLHVFDVKADEVKLGIAPAHGMTLREVSLRPYQTYLVASGRVVEGSLAVNSSLSK